MKGFFASMGARMYRQGRSSYKRFIAVFAFERFFASMNAHMSL